MAAAPRWQSTVRLTRESRQGPHTCGEVLGAERSYVLQEDILVAPSRARAFACPRLRTVHRLRNTAHLRGSQLNRPDMDNVRARTTVQHLASTLRTARDGPSNARGHIEA